MKKLFLGVAILAALAAGLLIGRTRQPLQDPATAANPSVAGAERVAAKIADKSMPLGASAPEFQLPGIDGRTWRLADFQPSKLLAVIFTCNHCPTAQAYEERIQALTTLYPRADLAVVAVSPNDPLSITPEELGYSELSDSFDETRLRASQRGFTFPYLYDGEAQAFSRALGPLATPHVFLFDGERKLRYKGRIDDSENPAKIESSDMRAAIDALLADKPVPTAQTRVFGCAIKWAEKRDLVQKSDATFAALAVELTPLKLDEATAKLTKPSGHWRLVNIWATWCAPCTQEFPHLVETYRMYRSRGLEVVTVSMDRVADQPRVLEFLRRNKASTTNYLFAGGKNSALADVLDAGWEGALPVTLLIAPDGTIVDRTDGPFDAQTLRATIVKYLGRTYY